MGILQQLFQDYKDLEYGDLGPKQLELLYEGFSSATSEDIQSIENGKDFIELLSKFRMAVAANDKFHGANYTKLLNSLLSVGEDGLYSNNLRFIFELIQNVDDCDFQNPEDCKLDMRFDFNAGKIILNYNERGFTPFNVFAITGIAEAGKNVSSEKTEIGEKGIGFKSVFGVAKTVLIQSGYFSFELSKDNFTIPVAVYDGYEAIEGTRMTLDVSPEIARSIYRQLANQYCNKEALFNKNPLLFLNKLTHLRFYFDNWRSLVFTVSRSDLKNIQGLYVEEGVRIAVDLHDVNNGVERNEVKEIECIRYSMPIIYNHDACQSRYGEETRVAGKNGKHMFLHIVAPSVNNLADIKNGTLYSFLPTQIQLNVPFAIHVPFKLDASREFVDPQDNNKWFTDSCSMLQNMLIAVYEDLADKIKREIVYYVPGKNQSIFEQTNEKIKCLSSQPEFKGARFLNRPIFFCENEKFYRADEVTCISTDETDNPQEVYDLLESEKYLFIPPMNANISKFYIEIQRDINNKIFDVAIRIEDKTEQCLKYLISLKRPVITLEHIKKIRNAAFSISQIAVFFRYAKILKLFNECSVEELKKRGLPDYSAAFVCADDITEYLYEDFDIKDVPRIVEEYLKKIGMQCILVDEIKKPAFFLANNVLFLSKCAPQEAFADLCTQVDSRDIFAANMKIRVASQQLNALDQNDELSIPEYMRQLRNVRVSVKNALGKKAYESYIQLILKSGGDSGRFVNELLQNADDCEYPGDAEPTFSLQHSHNQIITKYNEVGFTRANVRSITAIGESTKKMLLDDSKDTIGEKGVGFKTVFAIASEVKIDSGDFHFKLSDKQPTIPVSDEETEYTSGTSMTFTLRESFSDNFFTEPKVLMLCLCLRKLKKIAIGKFNIEITDTAAERLISINNTKYEFIRTDYSFSIKEPELILGRESNGRKINTVQHVYCYALKNLAEKKEKDFRVYCGLPTEIKVNVPLAIDAPFELTTSRDYLLRSDWNEYLTQTSHINFSYAP